MTSPIRPEYLDNFDKQVGSNLEYLHSIAYELWGYKGDAPRDWVQSCIKKAKAYLVSMDNKYPKSNRYYKDYKKFMAKQLMMRYEWDKPQELKTYISNDKEQKYYKRKE